MVGDKRKVLVMLAAPGVVEALVDKGVVIAGIYESPVTPKNTRLFVLDNTPSLRSLEIYIP